jgi:hypothetical protein
MSRGRQRSTAPVRAIQMRTFSELSPQCAATREAAPKWTGTGRRCSCARAENWRLGSWWSEQSPRARARWRQAKRSRLPLARARDLASDRVDERGGHREPLAASLDADGPERTAGRLACITAKMSYPASCVETAGRARSSLGVIARRETLFGATRHHTLRSPCSTPRGGALAAFGVSLMF